MELMHTMNRTSIPQKPCTHTGQESFLGGILCLLLKLKTNKDSTVDDEFYAVFEAFFCWTLVMYQKFHKWAHAKSIKCTESWLQNHPTDATLQTYSEQIVQT